MRSGDVEVGSLELTRSVGHGTREPAPVRVQMPERQPQAAMATAQVVPIGTAATVSAPTWQPSRYEAGHRSAPVALLASLGLCGALITALVTMNVVQVKKAKPGITVVEMLRAPEPPPPEPRKAPEPVVKQITAPTPIVAPPPIVAALPSPVRIATAPVPPPDIVLPGPPAPASPAPAPAPGVENAGDISSKMISATPPRYPMEARRKREQGIVVLLVLLGLDGSVADISISKSSGFDSLDKAALHAVRRWRWSPTQRNGAPVMVRGLVEIPFVLRG